MISIWNDCDVSLESNNRDVVFLGDAENVVGIVLDSIVELLSAPNWEQG